IQEEKEGIPFTLVEHDEDVEKPEEKNELYDNGITEEETVKEITHAHDLAENILPADDLPLEIKTVSEEETEDDGEKDYKDLPPYEPTLDLRDYKYPNLNMLETHGSEKIVHDPNELENNKN